jgi:hypothetical protein
VSISLRAGWCVWITALVNAWLGVAWYGEFYPTQGFGLTGGDLRLDLLALWCAAAALPRLRAGPRWRVAPMPDGGRVACCRYIFLVVIFVVLESRRAARGAAFFGWCCGGRSVYVGAPPAGAKSRGGTTVVPVGLGAAAALPKPGKAAAAAGHENERLASLPVYTIFVFNKKVNQMHCRSVAMSC